MDAGAGVPLDDEASLLCLLAGPTLTPFSDGSVLLDPPELVSTGLAGFDVVAEVPLDDEASLLCL